MYRYDIEDSNNTQSNHEVVLQAPFKPIDNLMFDANDNLYISSVNRGSILPVSGLDDYRIVSSGQLALPSGIAVLDDVVYTINSNGMYGYDSMTGQEVHFFEAVFGTGVIEVPTAVIAWESKQLLIQFSLLSPELVLWNPASEEADLKVPFTAPIVDAHPFQDDIIIAVLVSDDIITANGTDLENQFRLPEFQQNRSKSLVLLFFLFVSCLFL